MSVGATRTGVRRLQVPRPSPSARAALACALLVVLAGCSFGFAGDPTDTGTATPEPATPTGSPTAATPSESPTATPFPSPTPVDVDAPNLTVTGGKLPVDAGRVWALTMRLLGTQGTQRPAVSIEESMPSIVPEPPGFARRLGLETRSSEVQAAAYVRDPETVHVNERITDRPVLVEYTLAHEYVHVVQFRRDVFGRLGEHYEGSPDGRATARGVTEGTAVYAADVYWRRHLARGTRPAADIRRIHRNASGYTWYVAAPYYFGYRYAAARLDAPTGLSRVYDDPPRTTEELIHRLPPASEPPANMRVRVTGDDGWRERRSARAREGELFVRAVLRTELDAGRAARGADGWGNDTRLAFTREGRRGYAWVLRWDDRANATAFGEAIRAYLDGRATREDDGWRNGSTAYRVERAGDRTTVVYVGAPAFVANATAAASGDGTVTVRPSGRVAARAGGPQSVKTSGTAKVTTSPTARTTTPAATSFAE